MAESLLHLVHAASLVTFMKWTIGAKHRTALEAGKVDEGRGGVGGEGWGGAGRRSRSVSSVWFLIPNSDKSWPFAEQRFNHGRIKGFKLEVGSAGSYKVSATGFQRWTVYRRVLMFASCQWVTPLKKHVKKLCASSFCVFMRLSPPELIRCSFFPPYTPPLDRFHARVLLLRFLYNRRGRCLRRAPSWRR